MSKLSGLRRDYDLGRLQEDSLEVDPIKQFSLWLDEAIQSGLKDPNAMTIATVSADGQPSQRIVLLKDVSSEGFVFYTNLESRKAQELEHNAKISLHFPWHSVDRQVKVCGVANKLSTLQASQYFLSRPKGSQLAALVSRQSQPISSRQALLTKFEEAKEKFKQGQIPVPKFWGGYRVVPHEMEFWQGGSHRLHDRFCYIKQAESDNWSITRLMP